jgi:putative tRNA adenosine deaminase-associated protein
VAYTATLLIRRDTGWVGEDLDLDNAADLDAAVDQVRDLAAGDPLALAFVEENDEYVAVLRIDGDDEPRLFISDRRSTEGTPLAGRLFADLAPVEEDEPDDDDDEDDAASTDAEPGGDAGLLADLGTSADDLLALCAEKGMLPSDVIFALCEKAGCVDVLEEVRGGV